MPLTRLSESSGMFLTIKNHTLWQEIKKKVEGCEEITVTNPKTKQVMTKYGYKFKDATGYVIAIDRYKREFEGKVFAGYKLKMYDGDNLFFLDIPFKSIFFRKFSHLMHSIDFRKPLSIAAWKSKEKNRNGGEETAIWFTQGGESVKTHITKEHPNGCPPAVQDPDDKEWSFKERDKWLVKQIEDVITPRVVEAAKFNPKPGELHMPAPADQVEHADDSYDGPPNSPVEELDEDSVPF